MADYQILVGTKLDTSGIDTDLKSYKGKVTVKSDLDTSGIDNEIKTYKPTKTIEIKSKLLSKGITDVINKYKNSKAIKVLSDLDTKGIDAKIDGYSTDKVISIKADLDTKSINSQINTYNQSSGNPLISINAELNKNAISSAINEFNQKINAAKSKTKIRIKAEPDWKGLGSKIAKKKISQQLKIHPHLLTSEIGKQISDFNSKNKRYVYLKAKLTDGAITKALAERSGNIELPVDLKAGDTAEFDAKIKQKMEYYNKVPVSIPAILKPSDKAFTAALTKTPIPINATLNPEGINGVIEKFKPTSRINVDVKLTPKDINAEVRKIPQPTEPLEVGVKLDEKKLNMDIALYQPTATLGIKPDLIIEDVDDQIAAYVPKTKLKVNVAINDENINAGLKSGKNGQTPITVNVQLNREKLNEDIQKFRTNSLLTVGIKFDRQKVEEKVKSFKPNNLVTVGVKIDDNDIAQQVGNISTNVPIQLGVELDPQGVKNVQDQIDTLRQQIKSLGNVTINLNSGAGASGGGVGGNSPTIVTRNLREVDIEVKDLEDHVDSLKTALKTIGFDDAAVNNITKELGELDVVVKNVTTRLDRNGQLSLTIKGVDQMERAVTVMKRINKDGSTTNLGSSVSQSFKETENAFKRLKTIAVEMNKIKVKIAGLDAEKDKNQIAELTSQLQRCQTEYRDLYTITNQNLNTGQLDALKQKSIETSKAIKVVKAAMADKAAYNAEQQEIRETRDEYQKLIKIADSMKRIKVTLAGLDPEKDKQRIAELTSQLNNLQVEYRDLFNTNKSKFDSSQLDVLKQKSIETANAVKDVKSAMSDVNANKATAIRQGNFAGYDAAIEKLKKSMKTLSAESSEVKVGLEGVEKALEKMRNASDDNTLIEAEEEFQSKLKETLALLAQRHAAEDTELYGDTFETKKAAALERINNLFEEGSQASKRFGADAQKLRNELEEVGNVKGVDNVNRKIGALEKQIKRTGVQTQTFSTRLKEQFSKYSQYISVATIFMKATQAARSMFEQVKLIDSAMTELKKVTDETEASYNQFLSRAAQRSKELGTTIDGLVASTADFARLGYSFEDSQGLAEVANIYAVVGDEIEGVEGATESLISTMAAFKDDMVGMSNTDIAMSIIDTYNELGNKFAISSGGLGEALERSASSLAAANNTLHESAALITAANEVVQNPEKVGKVLPTQKMAISVKSWRQPRPRKDFISIFNTHQLGRMCIFLRNK